MWPWLLSSCLDGDFIFLLMIKVTPQFSKPQPSFIHSFILPLLRARPVPGFAPGTGGHRQESQTQEAGRESLNHQADLKVACAEGLEKRLQEPQLGAVLDAPHWQRL